MSAGFLAAALRRRPSSIHAGIASGSAPDLRHSAAAWGTRLVRLALGRALEDPGHFGQQVGRAGRELPQFGHRGSFLVAG